MNITRRQFLQFIAASTASVVIPAFASNRQPYVCTGEVVSYIGPSSAGFVGGQMVKCIGVWDGVGYLVDTVTNGYPGIIDTYYDFDLVDFNREIPDDFWSISSNRLKYNNFHTYVREQRFGETIYEAIEALNFKQSWTPTII